MSLSLDDYLDLSRDDARAQWRGIRARERRKRQVSFVPVEVILSFALFRVVDPHRFGGRNMLLLPDEVQQLARTLQRSPGSLTNKMLNLDGSRENAAAAEPALFLALHQDPALFGALYATVINAARDVGLDHEAVPDVLGIEAGDDIELLGQNELANEDLSTSVAQERERVEARRQIDTERMAEARIRIGQDRFARDVHANFEHRCGFCGFAPGLLRRRKLLVASHIKRWRDSTHHERLDVRNGIAACPTHDAAFDSGLIIVQDDLRIELVTKLKDAIQRDEKMARYFGPEAIGPHLIESRRAPDISYLASHRERVRVRALSNASPVVP